MKRARTRIVVLAVASLLALSAGAVGAGTAAAGSAAGSGWAACQAAEDSLVARSGIPIEVCPASPATVPSGPAEAPPASAADGPCTSTPVDKCELWVSAPYDGPAADNERVGDNWGLSGNAAATSPDGSIVFTAATSRNAPGDYDVVTLAYNAATGAQLWAQRYESPTERPEGNVQAVVAGPDGVYVTGYTAGDGVRGIGFTLAYDATTGEQLWSAQFPGWANDSAISADGSRVFVIGDDDPAGTQNAVGKILAHDAVTGEVVWSHTITGPGNRNLIPWRVDAAGDRVTYAASLLDTHGTSPGRTVGIIVPTYDASGTDEGAIVSRADVAVDGLLVAGIALNGDGSRAYVTHTELSDGEQRGHTIAVDTASGSKLWEALLDSLPAAFSYTNPWYYRPIDVGPDGSVYLTAFATPAASYGGEYLTAKYDAGTGSQVWLSVMGVASNLCWGPCGPSLSVNPKTGDIVGTATILTVNRTKAVTWQYSPSGTIEWTRVSSDLPRGATVQVAPTANGHFPAIVHSPDGNRVFVAGHAWAAVVDSASSPDVVVAAFDTTT